MISLIIPVYKRLDFLALIFQGLGRQSYKNCEIIVAEDNNAEETILFVEEMRKMYDFTIKHVSQEDIGFRKTKILNTAIKAATGEQLVFLDGDCIPHRHLLKEYAKNISVNTVCYGRRVCLSETISARLLQEKSIKKLSFLNAFLSGSKRMDASLYMPFLNTDKKHRGILGCNWGILREDIARVNGFDEDYERASVGEDTDIEWRLRAIGVQMKSMKNKAIVYHLYHKANYTYNGDTLLMQQILLDKKKENKSFCTNGIRKLDAKADGCYETK